MPTINHADGSFDYSLERSRRRTLAIHIDTGGRVVVRAPRLMRAGIIQDFLQKKAPWVLRKLAEARRRAAEVPRHTFLEGDVFLFRGEPLTLRVEAGAARNRASIAGSDIVVHLRAEAPHGEVEAVLRRWLIGQAREVFNDRVGLYSRELGVPPGKVSVRGQAKRWGSCSRKGNISLNWKLVMAPPDILDYVVAHEVCHVRHPNHGRDFWCTLGELMPDYAARRDWLKRNGHRLGL